MLEKTEFTALMDLIVVNEFPQSRLAWAESKMEVIDDLYTGHTTQVSTEETKGEFGFAAEATAALTLLKLVADTFVALKKAYEGIRSGASQGPDRTQLAAELSARLTEYLDREKAIRITDEVLKGVYHST